MIRTLTFVLDVLVVLVFVIVGRESHDEANAWLATTRTAAPFLIALVPAWVAGRAIRRGPVLTGVAVAIVTSGVGVLVRRTVFDEGVAFPFVFVTAGFLIAGMTGWRLVEATARRRSLARSGPATVNR